MSILFVLVTFLLFIAVTYLRSSHREAEQPIVFAPPAVPKMIADAGLEIPDGYAFHPGHTWVLAEDRQQARIGLDSFGANLLGKVERVEVPGLNRWIRQGQKVMKVTGGGVTVDLVAPVEGVVTAINEKVLQDPSLIAKDPYREGWVLMVQSPDLAINVKNLLRGSIVRSWMKSAIERVSSLTVGYAPAFAQDGGLPIAGLLGTVDHEVQREMIREFFLE
jgi:glycine cleavage system H lipoate-binding protein